VAEPTAQRHRVLQQARQPGDDRQAQAVAAPAVAARVLELHELVEDARLVFGGERLAQVKEPYYLPSRPGEFWLAVPTGRSYSAASSVSA